MTDNQLPPGLVLWPDDGNTQQRIAVLISDIHCTDCTVGNQTADDTDWKRFFSELGEMLDDVITGTTEVLLILNGDVVDLLRSGKWAAANTYPWQRDDPGFRQIVLDIMHDIVEKHAREPARIKPDERHARDPAEAPDESSGFFFYLQQMVKKLREITPRVTLIPIVGNHDKELQVVPEAREIFYRQCLGLAAEDLNASYRNWVAGQMNGDAAEPWPLLPFYFADPSLRLFATHGQWRDDTNSRATRRWKFRDGWQPHIWQQEQYRSFSDPCFGDTIASGLLSNFIWNTTKRIEREVIPFALNRTRDDGITRILHVLGEMDLYRPSERAVVRLLEEAAKLDRKDANMSLLFDTVIDQYRRSLRSWLAHPETYRMAPPRYRFMLTFISFFSRLNRVWVEIILMRLMARKSDRKDAVRYSRLPVFRADYQPCGFQLHAEGHTHQTTEIDLRNSGSAAHRNYTYVNLGAWRNRIVQKFDIGRYRLFNKSYRRRSIGRALIVRAGADWDFTLRDIARWGDKLDHW